MPITQKLSLEVDHWLKDELLSECSNATRGVWMDLLCHMHLNDRSGELIATGDQLAEMARCKTTAECLEALREIKGKQAGYVHFDGKVFTVRNRRMYRQAQKRKANAERQMRYREAHANDNVTPENIAFGRFWSAFPRGRKKSIARAREAWHKAIKKVDDPEVIIKAAGEYAVSQVGQGKYVKMPETWLNQECWNDDRAAWRDLDKMFDQPSGFRKVTREEFQEAVKGRQFKKQPERASSDPRWVFGTLKDGTKIECRDYFLPKNSSGTPEHA